MRSTLKLKKKKCEKAKKKFYKGNLTILIYPFEVKGGRARK